MRWLMLLPSFLLMVASVAAAGDPLALDQTAGFLEPVQTVRLTAPEAGRVTLRPVDEGSRVAAGDLLYQLDDAAIRAQLAIAEHSAARTSDRDAAAAELAVKKRRLDTLLRLEADGHSGGEELARAQADFALATASVTAAEESMQAAKLEVARLQVERDKRQVRAAISGVVTHLPLEVGETAIRSDEPVAVLVDIRTLRATFYLPAATAVPLAEGDDVQLAITPPAGATRYAVAAVTYVAAVTDAESGTVAVRVTLDNEAGHFRSGSPCRLVLTPADPLRFSAR